MLPATTSPKPAYRMYQVQRALSTASSYPIIGVVPAAVKTVVSGVEIVSATAFKLMLDCGGKKLCSTEFVEHEKNACRAHVTLGVLSLYYSLFGVVTIGWGPFITESSIFKND